MRKIRILVQLDEKMHRQLRAEVWAHQTRGNRQASMAGIIREALGAWLEGRSEGLRDKRVTLKGKVKR